MLTIFEHDKLVADIALPGCFTIPAKAFAELQSRLEVEDGHERKWLRLHSVKGKPVLQITGYAGVLRTCDGTQIEVLPKLGRYFDDPEQAVTKTRAILIRMLKTLLNCNWYETTAANLATERMPLLEVFIRQFLLATRDVVRRGIRNQFVSRQDNLLALRGKLLISQNIARNLFHPELFYTEHDEFLPDRPENRLIHSALLQVKRQSRSLDNQRLARELAFVFADIPTSQNIELDLQRKRLDRGMHYYQSALHWAELILKGYSPLTGSGDTYAPSLMFPMSSLFEAYVAKTLPKQLSSGCRLQTQVKSKYLVEHQNQSWMQLKPDFLLQDVESKNTMVLDAKWKLLNQNKSNSKDKYDISQADFYQLFAYGKYYLEGKGNLILIYPKTDQFTQALPVFDYADVIQDKPLKLWVVPYDLETDAQPLLAPSDDDFNTHFFNN